MSNMHEKQKSILREKYENREFDFVFLDVWRLGNDLASIRGTPGMCWDAYNCLDRAKTLDASSLCVMVSLEFV